MTPEAPTETGARPKTLSWLRRTPEGSPELRDYIKERSWLGVLVGVLCVAAGVAEQAWLVLGVGAVVLVTGVLMSFRYSQGPLRRRGLELVLVVAFVLPFIAVAAFADGIVFWIVIAAAFIAPWAATRVARRVVRA